MNNIQHALTMDVKKISDSLTTLKEQLKKLMSASAELIERNSLIDSGSRFDPNQFSQPAPRFEILLEDFLSTCVNIELNLRTMQEHVQQGRASNQHLPVSISGYKFDPGDARLDPTDQNVSYNQYLSAIKFQIDTAKSIRSILLDFVTKQQTIKSRQQTVEHH